MERYLAKVSLLKLLLLVQFMMQIKFNFSNFIFYGLCLPQRGSVPAAYAVVAGGRDWPIQ